MNVLDHSDDEKEQSARYKTASTSRSSSRFGARRLKRRSGTGSHQHLLLMDCVGGGNGVDGDGATEDAVPLPDYERLSQSSLPHDDDRDPRNAPPPPEQQRKPPPPPQQQQKPAAWRLIEYVWSRHRSWGGGVSDGDSKSSDGEKEGEDGAEESNKDKKKKKKRSSWLPDPDRRWPVQGFS
ncbi:hypothetical protein ACP70R_024579 [Stipagrostis hirtigluma subsp. patula]